MEMPEHSWMQVSYNLSGRCYVGSEEIFQSTYCGQTINNPFHESFQLTHLLLKVINHASFGHCTPVITPVNGCRSLWQGS